MEHLTSISASPDKARGILATIISQLEHDLDAVSGT
jgi:hypothetical protein